jgi:SPASM domain peptide maturase of grasp-with-spasm system
MIFFKLFSNCIAVKGVQRSTIIDLQKNIAHLIPNDLHEILLKSEKLDIHQIYLEYGSENKVIIEDYFKNLIDLELGFFCDEIELDFFSKMCLDFYSPTIISNAIIENQYNVELFEKIILQLDNLGCEYVEMLFYQTIENELLNIILNLFSSCKIKHIGLLLRYDSTKDKQFIKFLTSTKLRLTKLIITNSLEDETLAAKNYNFTLVNYIIDDINSFNFCGVVKIKYFSNDMQHFTESQHHNTCLNRKISIDKDGYIRNCPSMPQHFGNIKDTTLEEALAHPDFKKYWNVTKDMIAVCKDCEFRHICTDCRAYTERTHFEEYIDLSKPLKCGYNPYTNEWAEWSTNPLKQKAIEFYGMQDLVKKDA